MVKKEVKEILQMILGRNAYNNSMQVTKDTSKLVKSIDYLIAQLEITKRWCDDEGKEHINTVIKNLINILKDEI